MHHPPLPSGPTTFCSISSNALHLLIQEPDDGDGVSYGGVRERVRHVGVDRGRGRGEVTAFKKVQTVDKYPKGQSHGCQWKHLRYLLQAADASSLPPDRPNWAHGRLLNGQVPATATFNDDADLIANYNPIHCIDTKIGVHDLQDEEARAKPTPNNLF